MKHSLRLKNNPLNIKGKDLSHIASIFDEEKYIQIEWWKFDEDYFL